MITHTLLILFNAIFILYVRYTSFDERLARATNESSLSNMEDGRKETSMPVIWKELKVRTTLVWVYRYVQLIS